MRSFVLLSLFTLLLTTTIARPSQMDERNESEADQSEYEGNEESQAEENTQEDEDSRLSDQDASDLSGDDEARSQQLVKMGRENYQQQRSLATDSERGGRGNSDNLSEYSRNKAKEDETAQSSSDFSSLPKRRQSNRYIDNSDINDPPENVHLTNYKTNRVQGDARNNELAKRTIESHISSFDDSEAMYENNRENRNDGEKVEYNNEVVDSGEQGRHFKQYYNTMQADHKSMLGDRNYEFRDANRDRRQAEQSGSLNLSSSSTEKEGFSDISNEEDEAAIKRHIRKLSGEELEELLNSLSDDKKALLNKIMDGDSNYESINKREITKKAGAVDENGYIDSSLSEISKVQGGPSIDINTESAISPSTDVDNSKQQESQTETADISNTKSSETTRTESAESKVDLTRHSDDVNSNIKSEGNFNSFDASPDSSNVQSTKTENKRETNLDYSNGVGPFDDSQMLDNYVNAKDSDDSFNDQDHVCSQDDELAQLMDEEALLHNSHEQQYKREALESQADFADSIKSLEESFPNNNCEENGQYFESNMAPLVRVKRKNEDLAIKKRAAADSPEAKVAYFPYKAENDDEDNEEGSEFDDDGFYDRTSNYAKSNVNKPADDMEPLKYGVRSPQIKLSKTQTNVEEDKSDKSSNDKIESDTTSLGSDTDSVLSGVEGVDDNLMFSSGTRNRRTLEEDSEQKAEIEENRPLRSTPVLLEEEKRQANYINLPNYQESDAFGPWPRNEGELSRYKRIRRVKPSTSLGVTGE